VADPLLHDQVPYFVYVAAVVVATWFAGVGGGLIAMAAAAFVGKYFFVQPRYTLVLRREDLAAMLTFAVLSAGLVWLVGRWRHAETAMRELQGETAARAAELQTILDTVPAAVFVTRSPDAGQMEGNRYAAEYLRLPLGSNLSKTAPAEQRPQTFRVLKEGQEIPGDALPVQLAIASGAEVRDYEFDLVYRDNTKRTLFGNATPLIDQGGRTRGAIGAFLDVTELKRMEEQSRNHAEELDHANRVKDDFLATLSHELRTPLNAILGWSDMLLRPGLPAETQRRALASINRNARAQAALIADILDVSRMITGKMRLEVLPVDLGEVVRAACESVQPAADAKGVDLHTVVESRPVLIGDPDRLQQVLWNLLSNSVKSCSRGGHIEVDVRRVNSHIRIRVTDDGIGIAPDLLPHVFERFRQADTSTARTQTGLGLGLAIVRHLVELHGGTVLAESDGLGQGATFTVTLPVRAVMDSSAAGERVVDASEVASAAPAGCLEGLHVVAVDDQEEARILIQAVLGRYGAKVTTCSSAEEVIATVARERPDVLLADIGMPLIDGYELIRRIRALPAHGAQPLPAVALTAYGSAHDRSKALAAGYWEHVAKPIIPDALVRIVAGVAGRAVGQ
jgi:signal transduction histidine kinase